MKRLPVYIALLFSLSSFGQMKTLSDTLKIKEVIVNGRPYLSKSENRMMLIDSTVLKDYSHNNISEIISQNTPIFVKNYGPGGIATMSLRGTSAEYTQLAWNGVNINSPMLGQTDLSLIPAGFIDNINFFYGGASLTLNSGGIGGIINMETKPSWKDETNLIADISAGSFGKYSALLKIKTGNIKFQSSTKVLYQSAENDFPYLNNFTSADPVTEKRKNAEIKQNAFMQELYFRGDKNVLSARIWYQEADNNIPVPIVSQQPEPGENQKDEFIRTMINYSGYSGKTDYNSSISWFNEKLNYQNPLLSINSKNLTNTINLKSGFETYIDEKTRLSIILNDEISIVNSVNYNGIKSRNLAGVTASARRIFSDRLGITALIRPTIEDNNFLIPDFSTGIDYKLLINRDYFIKINLSHNSRVPTLNDLYWNPGGNPSLKNEYSYTGELTYEMNGNISAPLSFSTQTSLFLISIDNMINWLPGESGYWSPSNISESNSSGAEENINLTYINNSFKIRFTMKYEFDRAHIIKSQVGEAVSGKQIVYTPENLFNAGIRAGYKNYYLSWLSCFTGKRYTTADNSDWLSCYLLNNVSAGIKFSSGKNSFDINLKADNLFNVNYQAIAWYPMPGRSFVLTLIYQFTK
jgi:outer membrane cobalamin receptor